MSDPYVIVGVARTRQGWFSEVARWSTSGAAPVEFLKCLTTDEARALLGSGRRASALLVDAATPGLDRELTADAAAFGVQGYTCGNLHPGDKCDFSLWFAPTLVVTRELSAVRTRYR